MRNKNLFWICGKHTVLEALRHRSEDAIEVLVNSAEKLDQIKKINNKLKVKIATNKELSKKLNNNEIVHQGYVTNIHLPKILTKIIDFSSSDENFIILDGVTDPRNIGSIIRTSVAFGVNNLIVKEREFNMKSATMYKSASGAIEKIKIFQYPNIKYAITKLIENGFRIICFDIKGKHFLSKNTFSKKNVFVFGSEGKGISDNILKLSDEIVKIRIQNVESLNVSNSVSAAFSLYNYLNKS